LHKTFVTFTLLSVAILLLLTDKHPILFLSENFLKTNNIEYSKVEGTLLNGLTLYDVKYKNILYAKKLKLHYTLLSILELRPIIKDIQTQHLSLNLDALPKSRTKNKEDFHLIPFSILNINLNKTELISNKKHYFFTLQIKNLLYKNKKINTNSLLLTLQSYYADATIQAKIINNKIIAHSDNLTPTKEIRSKYLHSLQGFPKQLAVDCNITTQKIDVATNISQFGLVAEKNLSINNQHIFITYLIDKNSIITNTHNRVTYKNYSCIIKERGELHLFGDYNATVGVHFIKSPKNIPIKNIAMSVKGDTKNITLNANASGYLLHIDSHDYNRYKISLNNQNVQLDFLNSIPKAFKKDKVALHASSTLSLSPFFLKGLFYAKNSLAKLNGTFYSTKEYKKLFATIKPKLENPFFKGNPLCSILPLQLTYTQKQKEQKLKIDANKLEAFIIKNSKNKLIGKGNYASALFRLKGNIDKKEALNININTTIPSIKQLLKETNLSTVKDKTIYDGKIAINSQIDTKGQFSLKSRIEAPFLSAKTNAKNLYVVKDIRFNTGYKNHKIEIYNYTAKYKEQQFHSNKLSQISIDKQSNFHIEKFFIFNDLLLKGVINPLESNMSLNLHSEKFALKTKDFNLTAKTNINIKVENTKKQTIDGNITLLGGTLSYQPQQSYTSHSDKDIIIVQNMQKEKKKEKKNNLTLNLHINAKNPLQYKTKEINIHFMPNLILKKKATKKIKIYGKVTITDGTISAKSKKFQFDKSVVIFSGADYLNPQINIKLHFQTIDYKDIIILVSNRVDSPVIIFSSNPPMSQNDIMSYILFGEPATTLFDNSSQSKKTSLNFLLLGTGIKTLFNTTTGIHVDTLNILNNANGTLGYEIGARLNNKLRIVYKNDISSTMTIQYSLNKSFRIDVDAHDTGEGVYFVYTKDFKGF